MWGSGTPRREFLHVDDLADACVFLMNLGVTTFSQLMLGAAPSASTLEPFVPRDKLRAPQAQRSFNASLPVINIDWGKDSTIRELANLVSRFVEYEGKIVWDTAKPDGTPRKLLDFSRLKAVGWSPKIGLEDGIRSTYEWYLDQFIEG